MSPLADTLLRHGGRGIVMLRPGGNFGDYLIYRGARALCDRLGLSYRDLDWTGKLDPALEPEQLLYIHGSGGFVSWCSGTPFELLRYAVETHPGVVVVGPHTFSDEPDLLRDRLGACLRAIEARRVVIFAREPTSLALIRDFASDRIEILLDHDTAFHVPAEALGVDRSRRMYPLFSIRCDRESARAPAERPWWWVDPTSEVGTLDGWLRLHAAASRVVTDRLHSAVLGAILGKQTFLIPGSYHKNESVWGYSLKQRGVRLIAAPPTPAIAAAMDPVPGLRRGLYSWKLHRWWLDRINALAAEH